MDDVLTEEVGWGVHDIVVDPIPVSDGSGDCQGGGSAIISGRIKWFNATRGYGFIIPDEDDGDILFHYNLLAGHDRKALVEGARVRAVAGRSARGRQALLLLEIDPSAAVGASCPPRLDPRDYLRAANPPERGEVRWFNRTRGYGFLLASDGVTQIFVHMETVRRGGFDILHPGQRLLVRTASGPRGLFAVTIAPEETRA